MRYLLSMTAVCSIFFVFMQGCVEVSELKSANQAYQAGNLEQAYEQYQVILQKSPDNKEAKQAIGRIKKTFVDRAMNRVETLSAASSPLSAVNLREIIAVLDKAGHYAPQNKILGKKRQQYEQSLNQVDQNNRLLARQCQTALRAGQFSLAADNLTAISQSDPSFPGLAELQQGYVKNYAQSLEKEIKQAVADNNLTQARKLLNDWQSLNFDSETGNNLATLVSGKEIAALKSKTGRLMASHKFITAYLQIINSPFKKELTRELDRIRRQGAPFYLNQARKRLARGENSRAYIETIKGFELDPDYPGMFEVHRDCRDLILKKVQKYIAIPRFGAPQGQPDLGPQFSDALISYLFRILPYGINIVERGKIDMLMEEQRREFKEVGQLLNVDLIVTGNVSLLDIDRQQTTGQSTVRAKVGEKKIINPAYELYLKSSQNHQMSSSPPAHMISEDIYENFTYTKGSATVKGFANVGMRIFDTAKGSITYAQEFNANYQQTDDFQDGVEVAQVIGDSLRLPTDTEILEKLRGKIISQLAKVIQEQFAKREHGYLQEANYYMSRHEKTKALDPLAWGYLYCVKADVAQNDMDYSQIREKIVRYTEDNYL